MRNSTFLRHFAFFAAFATIFSSCLRETDPGPLQSGEKDFALLNFDRLEVGGDFIITVKQSEVYSIHAHGDRRNVEDLDLAVAGNTITVRYKSTENRTHVTYIDFTMPTLTGANLSGAANTTISGFKNGSAIELIASGSTVTQLNVETAKASINLSGASQLVSSGKATSLTIKTSGASAINSYALAAESVDAETSGASTMNVFASKALSANASGASVIYFRGNPGTVTTTISGASVIKAD